MLCSACIALLTACSKSSDSVKKTETPPSAPAPSAESTEPVQNTAAVPVESAPTQKRSVFAPLPVATDNPAPAPAPAAVPTVNQAPDDANPYLGISAELTGMLNEFIAREKRMPKNFREMVRHMDTLPSKPPGMEWVINEKNKTVELRKQR